MELVENPYVSDFTKKTLHQFGWAAGDPIPADLGANLLALKEKLPPSERVDVLIDIAAMDEQDIKTVTDALTGAKDYLRRKTAADEKAKVTKNMSESVRAAYEKFAVDDAPQIVDDREAAVEEPAPAPAPEPAPVVTDVVPESQSVGGLGPMVIAPFCPRCGWDMMQKFDVDVTEDDKVDFLATLLGGSRFRRNYELVGGNMVLRLRSVLGDENFLIQRQLLLDQDAGEILSEAEWFLRMAEYRMACSLDAILDKDGKVLAANPELGDLQFTPPADKPTQTALVLARKQVNSGALAHEVTRRLVAAHLRKFNRLVESLESMALEPSFWNGIE